MYIQECLVSYLALEVVMERNMGIDRSEYDSVEDLVGSIVIDTVNQNHCVVYATDDRTADEITIRYDWNCNPITVYEENEKYEFEIEPDTEILQVVYPPFRGYEALPKSARVQFLREFSLQAYAFPLPRLEIVSELDSAPSEVIRAAQDKVEDRHIVQTAGNLIISLDNSVRYQLSEFPLEFYQLGDFTIGVVDRT